VAGVHCAVAAAVAAAAAAEASQQHSIRGLHVCRALISRGSRKGRDWPATARALRWGPVTNDFS
jgi:hypothetical protein